MTGTRFRLVRRPSPSARVTYEGVDLPAIGESPDVPEDLLRRALAVEKLPPGDIETAYRELLPALAQAGTLHYDLLCVDEPPPSQSWAFLGYDVAERTPAAWSAIAHRADILSPKVIERWEGLLNDHGLFGARQDAERYLASYLENLDPDGGWGPDGWTDQPDFYAVIAIYRHEPATAGSRQPSEG
jgi:hypothetical protein